MLLDRRMALKLGAAAFGAGLSGCGAPGRDDAAYAPKPEGWRRFAVTTALALPRPGGAPAQAWVPVPSLDEADWSRAGAVRWTGNAQDASLVTLEDGARMVHAVWPAGSEPARLEVEASAATRDRAVDLDTPRPHPPLLPEERARYTASTSTIPTDGIVAETAKRVVGGARGDLEKAKRIYDWVVENTERNPRTRGCGPGDIEMMLTLGRLSGKCADLNTLYVGLARAAGLPARDLYGVRVAPSAFGYRSLGAGSADVTKAQHCRAGVFLDDYGWVPVDPADVRKVVREETDDVLPLRDPRVRAVRAALFGAWEGNWVAYNAAHDVPLPGSGGRDLPFFMYPEAEIGGARLDPLDPARFVYTIEAREIAA